MRRAAFVAAVIGSLLSSSAAAVAPSAQESPTPPSPLIPAPSETPPFSLPRLGTGSGPGAGSSLILVEELGSRVEHPVRLVAGRAWAVTASYSDAPDFDAREYRIEASIRRGLAGVGAAMRRRDFATTASLIEPAEDGLRDVLYQAGAAVRTPDGRLLAGVNVGEHRSQNLGLRGQGRTWSAAVAVQPLRRVRLSALTLDRAARTRWAGTVIPECPGEYTCTHLRYDFTSPAARMLAVSGELLPARLGRLELAGGVEYARYTGGRVDGDEEWRCGASLRGSGRARLRITAERLNEGARRGWIISAGVTVAAGRAALGFGNRFARNPDHSALGDVRTYGVGYMGR